VGGKMIPQAPIQRLIILHDGLISSSINNSSCLDDDRRRGDPGVTLSEDASLEEHAEFVLYYYDHSLLPISTTTLESSYITRHVTEDAVRFAGLCRALRSLPRALIPCDLDDNDDDDHDNNDDVKNSLQVRYAEDVIDEAEIVHFSESTLIYVPLELDGNVFAVAQIPRRACSGGAVGSADPISIKNVIQRIHTEFALFNGGGGVHRSLLRTKRLECTSEWMMGDVVRTPRKMSTSYVTSNNDWRYGGMAELFELRRERRKITQVTSSNSPTSLIDCDHRIRMLLRVLPMTTLRAALVAHYDNRVRHIVGRRFVDDVPCLNTCPRSVPNEFVCLTAAEFLKAMVRERVPKVMANRGGRLHGMSFFYQDGLVHSEFAAAACDDDRQGKSDTYIIQHNAAISIVNNILPGKMRGGRNIDRNHGAVNAGFVTYTSSQADTSVGPIDFIYIRGMEKYIRLQRIYLPVFDVIDLDNEIKTFVAMFESHDLTFLLFFELPGGEQGEEMQQLNDGSDKSVSSTTQALIDALVFLNDELTQFCCIVSKADSSASTASIKEDDETTFRGEPGMDIIHINRDEHSFVIYSQQDLPQNVGLKRAVSKPKFGLRGKGIKSKDITVASPYSNHLDCRHKLAATLPSEVMLALDEMFNEIGCFTGRSDSGGLDVSRVDIDSGSPKSIELCTFLPQGWVYGRACGGTELYIVLDPSKFMTVNEVQKKTTRIREMLGVE
jgi:hypothetical protein